MSNIIPAPPVFKSSFIQMQRPQMSNEEPKTNYLTSSYIPNEEHRNNLIHQSPSISPMTHCDSTSKPLSPKLEPKKRRRSSSKEDSERKRKSIKAQHSIIEKKRRIKMNREFEALKFIVPACRTSILSGLTNSNSFENSHLMHKLTILQSTVEYIKYLHLIIRLMKLQMLLPKDTRSNYKSWFQKNTNLDFVDFDLYLDRYRDIEKDFDFEEMFLQVWKNKGTMPEKWLDPITIQISKFLNEEKSQKPPETVQHPIRQQSQQPEQVRKPSISTGSIVLPKINHDTKTQHQVPLTPMTLLSNELPIERKREVQSQSPIKPPNPSIDSFRLPLPAILNRDSHSPTRDLPNPDVRPNRPSDPNINPIIPQVSKPRAKSIGVLTSLPYLVTSVPMSPPQPTTSVSTSISSSSSESYIPNYYFVKDTNLNNSALPVRGKEIRQMSQSTVLDRSEEHEASQVLISLRTNKS